MSKNRYGAFTVGQSVNFHGEQVVIEQKLKGNKTHRTIYQGGVRIGHASNPCLYRLSNGYLVRGSTLIAHGNKS